MAAVRKAATRETMTAVSMRSAARRSSLRPRSRRARRRGGRPARRAEPLMAVTSCEPPALVVDGDGNIGQRGRVLPVVVRAEQQVLATTEQDADVGLSATAVAAARGVHR